MNITIKGSGRLISASPVPDSILALAQPHFTVEDAPDGGLWLELSPYIEVYDEDSVQTFLRNITPYISSGTIECTLEIARDHVTKWTYMFTGSDCYRSHQTGSCMSCHCINR